jgi:hypothetical protein
VTRIAFAVFIGTFLIGGNAIAACVANPPANSQTNKARTTKARTPSDYCVDLNTVPQISANIVATEPAPAIKPPTYSVPTTGPYEGPTLGMAKPDPGVKPTPTIGYHWQLQ